MKTRNLISSATLIILFFSFLAANAQYRSMPNTAWKRGEKLTYIIYFDSFLTGKIKAAYGTFEVMPETETVGGRTCNHIVASGATFKKYNWAIFVNDRFDSYVDEQGQFPLLFLRRAHEGNFTADQDIIFNHGKNLAQFKNNKKDVSVNYYIPTYAQDMISAGYYARNLDLSSFTTGQNITIPYVFEDSLFSTTLVYDGIANLKMGLGTFSCIKLKPKVLVGTVFGEAYPLTIYVTNDKNRIPIYAKSSILIGTVKFELISYSGLKNPLDSKKK
ncbi:MAG TPA: hypothetical protein DHV29_03900 [Bacteroidales bacterium]|nr:hypothetical protein [Bacteroidales bacterium]HCB61787.1 hypothetical protein [Bacteroidales bacterium]HCY22616.1 hypothetical protein [Bacteroidales bacterium]